MSIEPNTNFANGNYKDTLYATLKLLEGRSYTAYLDTNGIPHIGIGFNLQVTFDAVAAALGIARNSSYFQQLQAAVGQKYPNGYDI